TSRPCRHYEESPGGAQGPSGRRPGWYNTATRREMAGVDSELVQVVARIPEATVCAFEQDGAVLLRQMYDTSWIRLIEAGIERDLADPGPYGRLQSGPDDPGRFFTDYYMWRRIPELKRFALEGPGGAIAARLTRSQQINYFYDGLFVKEPGTVKPTL